jgi:putative alpha-1,2-mannosidase
MWYSALQCSILSPKTLQAVAPLLTSLPGVVNCTDNGFWDTFRTVYPMLSLIYPDHLGTIVQGKSLL